MLISAVHINIFHGMCISNKYVDCNQFLYKIITEMINMVKLFLCLIYEIFLLILLSFSSILIQTFSHPVFTIAVNTDSAVQ